MGFLCGGDDLAISKDQIADIKNAINIVDIIGEVVSLTKAGRNFLGLCPFHNEKTPSFNVIEDKQFYHCFGCGKSGDVFKFLEEYRQITFMESVQILAERSGISIAVQEPQVKRTQVHPHQKIFLLNQDASKFYHAVLMTTTQGQEAKNYLYSRGLTDEIISYFNIGLSPSEPDYLYQAMSKKYDEDTLMQAGLFNLSENNRIFDAFQNRIMFPLTDDGGHILGFSGRIWTEEDKEKGQAKYKNTRTTPVFNKSYELYHMDRAKAVAKKTHEIYLMEGFMDVIAAYRSGITNAVASMGTALTPEHVRHLKQYTKKVILTYDGDSAGQNAIAKSLEILREMTVEIVRMPNQLDPDEFLQRHSEEALAKLLTQSRLSSTEFWIYYLKPVNTDNLQAQIAYVEKISELIAQVPSLTAQNTYINLVADLLPDFDYMQVEQAVNNHRLIDRKERQEKTYQERQVIKNLPLSKALTALHKAENQLFHRILHHPYLLNEFKNRSDFSFKIPELQSLYLLLKKSGEISALDLSLLSEEENRAYYQVLEEILPPEVAEGEIVQIEERIYRLLEEQKFRHTAKSIRESSNHGDIDRAVEELQALISQKRKLE
ncbi:DNA primase [Streptococcus sp. S784/96/1]|uniref:DNA primase n=1 Tax=Streptococcus sp. S784/96/1 TaxID=2653499 RepID=UPI00192E9370|nr:DNA primase [Streptococcus sp. S784/96/1]